VALRIGLVACVAWLSPDGRRVAFERSGSTFTVRVAGGAARRLLRGAREPSWSR